MGANAVTTVYDFTAGQVLTAAQMDNVNCGIPVFATTTTRDAAFGGTGEKTLAEGQMAYIENIAGSSAVQYYDGAAWQTLVQGGLVLISSTTIGSAVSTVTVSNCFSTTYNNYLIIASAITFSINADEIRATINGTTGNTYQNWGVFTTGGLAVTGNGGSNQASAVVGISSTGLTSLVIEMQNPFATAATQYQSRYGGQFYGGFQNGADTNAASSTNFTLKGATSTMTGGTIRVYGYQNS